MYSKYALQIKEMKILPYWLRQLKQTGEQQCTFLILQLIYAALAIDKSEGYTEPTEHQQEDKLKLKEDRLKLEKIASDNYKIFNESNGLEIVTGCLSYGFLDLKNEEKFKKHLDSKRL